MKLGGHFVDAELLEQSLTLYKYEDPFAHGRRDLIARDAQVAAHVAFAHVRNGQSVALVPVVCGKRFMHYLVSDTFIKIHTKSNPDYDFRNLEN